MNPGGTSKPAAVRRPRLAPLPPTTEEDVEKYLTLSPDYGLEYALAEDQEYYKGGTLE